MKKISPKRGKARAWVGLLLLVVAGLQGTARAETVVTPRIVARAEYDDNIRFTPEDPADDFVLRLSPSVMLSHRTERLHTNTSALVRAWRYLEETDLDREDILLDTASSYALTERLSLEGDASFQMSSALESELRETGLVTDQVDRMRMSAGGGITYRLTELQDLGGSFSLGRTEYDGDRLLDYETAYAALTWTRNLRNQRDSFTLQPYWSSNSSEVSEVQSFGLMVGWTRMLTENWRLSAFLGVRRTETESRRLEQEVLFDPTLLPGFPFVVEVRTVTLEETSWGGVADVSAKWTHETWSLHASYNRDLSYTSQGEPIERDRLRLSLRKKFDERLSAQCTGTAILSQVEGALSSEDSRHYALAPSFSYRLTETHRINAGFRYDFYENRIQEKRGRDRKRVWVSLDCAFPQLW